LYTSEWPRRDQASLQAALVIAGAGAVNAAGSCQSLIDNFSPAMVVSVGFAGALVPELGVGAVVIPAQVAREGFPAGLNYSTEFGQGILVSVNRVVGMAEKSELAKQYGACAVEMEAAAVAEVARARGVKFAAIKVISDRLDDEAIAITSPFVRPQGFNMKGFLFHAALHPKLWPTVAKLKRSSEQASLALCRVVQEFLGAPEEFATRFKLQDVRHGG
jgi:adenosylhomocysteine nucleosidase